MNFSIKRRGVMLQGLEGFIFFRKLKVDKGEILIIFKEIKKYFIIKRLL